MSETKIDEQSADKRERSIIQTARTKRRRLYKVVRAAAQWRPNEVFGVSRKTLQVTYV